ncbi:adenylyl cyclase-associated protein 1 isoform X2 [Panulirus ornatus]|uniref:adenylyl cyclase-associated protein 1 isoform X2 n=1 Tax=Panulirus ornatus TaxID=150431 RepID=UPI003A8A987F
MGSATSSHQDDNHHVHHPTDSGWCGRYRDPPHQSVSDHSYGRRRGHRHGRPGSVSLDEEDSSPGDGSSSARSSSSDSRGSCSQCSCSDCNAQPTPRPRPSHSSPTGRSHTPPRLADTNLGDEYKQDVVIRGLGDLWVPDGSIGRPQGPCGHSPDADRSRYTLRGDTPCSPSQITHATSKTHGSVVPDRRYDLPEAVQKALIDSKGTDIHRGEVGVMAGSQQVQRNPRHRLPQTLPSSVSHNNKRGRSSSKQEERNKTDLVQVLASGRQHPEHWEEAGHCRGMNRELTLLRNLTEPRHFHPRHLGYCSWTRPWEHDHKECTVPFVLAYDDLLSGPFKTFFDCSMKIGGDVENIAKLVQSAFINQRAFLVMATKSQRPLDTELPEVLEPTGKKIQEVISYRESNRQSQYFNHLSAVSESITALSWVAVTPAPAPYVKEMGDSAVFYTNKVLKEYREKDKLHVEWVQNWNNVFKELQEYVKKYHTTGLSWNSRGGNAMANLKAAPANCGVPPPPPSGNIPPPPPMMKLEPKPTGASDDGRAALFESINKGTAITSGLKKVDRSAPRRHSQQTGVTDDMKTHKNPSLREGPKPFVKQSSPLSRVSPARDGPTGRPRVVLEGKKWFVEYQNDKPDIIIKEAKMDQSVYIFRCQNTIVQIKGKLNSVILDSCKKSSVVFDNLVSSAEVVNCQSCQVQVMGVMPILSIEKTDGCQVYLSKSSLNTEIVTAKSSEMNILIPKDDGEFVECPIPEQFKTVINGLALSTTCSEKKG